MNEKLSDLLLDKYRKLIGERYTAQHVFSIYDNSKELDSLLIDELREYFLTYVYPDGAMRQKLNEAFGSLEKHLANPKELLALLGDFSGLVIRFGFQLPKAIKAGMTTLNSFKAASKLEKSLLEKAEEMKLKPPVSDEDFMQVLKSIDPKRLKLFVYDFEDLLKAITDTSLLRKTIDILTELLEKMKQKERSIFTQTDIDGIAMGINILQEGCNLFEKIGKERTKEVIKMIVAVEEDFIKKVVG